MARHYAHLGDYSDLVAAANKAHRLWPPARPGKAMQKAVREILGFDPSPARPRQVRVEDQWVSDGVAGELVTWSVGYGPRTQAWYLRPAGETGKLPGIIALHDHGGFKFYGKEKIASGPGSPDSVQRKWWDQHYGGRPWANELARRGFAVLVPDVFCWGSRKFPLEQIPPSDRHYGRTIHQQTPAGFQTPQMSEHSWASVFHEHTIQRYCHALGTSMAGIVAYEDRIAESYLAGRKDVRADRIGCIGLSGGGLRSTLLRAAGKRIKAAVVVGLMSTYAGLLDHNVISHTWMLFPSPQLAQLGDWPDLAACQAPLPLMVQYDREDSLFTMQGMRSAHRRLSKLYRSAGKPKNYVGEFYDGPHKFDLPMQESAFVWLDRQLR